MEQPTQVLIADDTEVAREGLERLLADFPDIAVVGKASTITQTLLLARQLRPDIILLDLKWSGDDTAGTSAIRYLREEVPESRIIAITVYDHLIRLAREAGADVAITKDFTRDQLVVHIRALSQGERLPPARAAHPPQEMPGETLTEREVEILRLLSDGLSDREIGARLFISENTVKRHVSNILGKVGAQNRTQAVIIGLRTGLLQLD